MSNESDAQQRAWVAYDAARRIDPGEKSSTTQTLKAALEAAKAVREAKSR